MTLVLRTVDDIKILESQEEEIKFPKTGPDFYDYERELKAVWKVWHKEDR